MITSEPQAATTVYDGKPQKLVTIGKASNGTIYYRLDSGMWKTSIPVATKVGEHTVSWYLKADEHYTSDSSPSEPAGAVEAVISPRELEFIWGDKEFVYNGQDQCPEVKIGNTAEGDTIDAEVSGEATAVGPHTAKVSAITGDNVSCYSMPLNRACPFTIVKADIPDKDGSDGGAAVKIESWTYGDEPNEPEVEGNTEGANEIIRYKKADENDDAYSKKVPTEAGDYIVEATIEATAGYNEKKVTEKFSIQKKTASLKWSDTSLAWTGSEQAPTCEVKNLVSGDECDVTVDGAQKNAGTYKATAAALTGADSSNYAMPSETGTTFTISKNELIPTVTMSGWTYGEKANAPSVSGNTGKGKVAYSYKKSGQSDSEYKAAVPSEAGKYTVRATIEATPGYEAATATTDFAIEKKTAGLMWKGIFYTYDGASHVPSATVNNAVNGDKPSVTVTGAGKNAGEYVAKATGLRGNNASNYRLPDAVTQTFVINKADMTYSAKGWNGTYDGKKHGITVKVDKPEGAVVRYGNNQDAVNKGNSPAFKAEGAYTVYYQITAANYNTVTGSETVNIVSEQENKAEPENQSASEPKASSAPKKITNHDGRLVPLKVKPVKQGRKSISLKWRKIRKAKKYVIYGNRCNSKNHKNVLVKLGETSKNKFKITHIGRKKLKPGTNYKFKVVAYNKKGKAIESSPTFHVVTKGGKWKNYTGLRIKKPAKGKVVIKKGRTLKIKAVPVGKKVKKHIGLMYESSSKKVARVTKNGKIKAVKKGKCKIYVCTQNGIYKTIKVTVK